MSHIDPTVESKDHFEHSELEALVVENEMMLVEINVLRRRVTDLETQLADKTQDLHSMKDLHAAIHADKDRLKEELSQLRHSYEDLQANFNNSEEEVMSLRESLQNCLEQLEAQTLHPAATEDTSSSSKVEEIGKTLQQFFAGRQASVENIRRCVISSATPRERIRPDVERNILSLRKLLEASRRLQEDHQGEEEPVVALAKSNFGNVVVAAAEAMIEMLTQFADAVSPVVVQPSTGVSQEPSSSRSVSFWQKR